MEKLRKLQSGKYEILIEKSKLQRRKEVPTRKIRANHAEAFSKVLRSMLFDKNRTFAKEYLRATVSEITVTTALECPDLP